MSIFSKIKEHPVKSALFGLGGLLGLGMGVIGFKLRATIQEVYRFQDPTEEMVRAEMHTKCIKLDENRILEYSEFGNKNGKPLLVLPGFYCSRYYELFIHLGSWIEESKYHIVIPSLPGTGNSSLVTPNAREDSQLYTEEILSALMKLCHHTNIARTISKEAKEQLLHTPLTTPSTTSNLEDDYSPFTPYETFEALNILSFDISARLTMAVIDQFTNRNLAIGNVTFVSPHLTIKPLITDSYMDTIKLHFDINSYIEEPNVSSRLQKLSIAEAAYYLKNGVYGLYLYLLMCHTIHIPTPKKIAHSMAHHIPTLSIKIIEGKAPEQTSKDGEKIEPRFFFSSHDYFSKAKQFFHEYCQVSPDDILQVLQASIQDENPDSSGLSPRSMWIKKVVDRFDFDIYEAEINEHLFYGHAKEILAVAMGKQLLYLTPV